MPVTPFKTRKENLCAGRPALGVLTGSIVLCACFGCLRLEFRPRLQVPSPCCGYENRGYGGVSGSNGQVTGALGGHEKTGGTVWNSSPGSSMNSGCALVEESVDEGTGLEGGQIVGAFAQADKLDGHAQLFLDSDHNAALG